MVYNISKQIFKKICEEVGYFFFGLYYDINFYHWCMTNGKTKGSRPLCVWSITYGETIGNTLATPRKFNEALKKLDPASYIFQLEKGKKTGRHHYQLNLRLKEPMVESKLREKIKSYLRHKTQSPYYGKGCMHIKPTVDKTKADFYCMKEDTRIWGPMLFPANTYIGQDLIKKFYPWQESILKMVKSSPNDRAITLVCDPSGNKGKSLLAKTLSYHHDACVIPLGLSSAQMKSAIVSAGPREIYLLDLPRNNKSFIEIFDTIEEIKRGFIISPFHGKYKEMHMLRPHVVCFANEWPPLDFLSFDMWDLHEITSDLELKHVDKLTIQRFQNQNKKNNEYSPYSRYDKNRLISYP